MKIPETFAWVWLATGLVAAAAACLAVIWFSVPREGRLLLGTTDDFPVGQPAYRALTSDTRVYMANVDGTPVAWDARAAVEGTTRCRIRWVPTNRRFEDPCSGNKWCLDGTIADNRYGADRTLDRYLLEVDADGQVWLRAAHQATGTPMLDVPESTPFDPYTCDHLR